MINQGEDLHSTLLELALKARSLREIFDHFWKTETARRPEAHHAYFIRHVSLINVFDDFLFLFCSRQLWSAGGTGYWATRCGINGPLQALSNGDQIDKIIILLSEHKQVIADLFDIYQHAVEREHLNHELNHIKKTIQFLSDSLNEIQI